MGSEEVRFFCLWEIKWKVVLKRPPQSTFLKPGSLNDGVGSGGGQRDRGLHNQLSDWCASLFNEGVNQPN